MTQKDDREDLLAVYDAKARDEARVAGLFAEELDAVLGGRVPTQVVPPRIGEELDIYACRAVDEFLVRYVARWHGSPAGRARSDAPAEPSSSSDEAQ